MDSPKSIKISNLGNKNVLKSQGSDIIVMGSSPVEDTEPNLEKSNDTTPSVLEQTEIKIETSHITDSTEPSSVGNANPKDLSSYEPSFNSQHTVSH